MTIDAPVTAAANPFASRHIDALPFHFEDGGLADLAARLEAQGGRGAIVGPHGSGKTTLIERLGARLADEGWRVHAIRTIRGQSALDQLPRRTYGPDDAVLLDGAGHVGAVQWRRVLMRVRGAGRFVVTAHTPGRLPTLLRCNPSLALLDDLISGLAPGDFARLKLLSHALFAHYNGNIRDVLRGLYDHCAGLAPPSDLTIPPSIRHNS